MTNTTSAYDVFKQTLAQWGIPMGADIEAVIRQAVVDGTTPDQIDLIIPDIQSTQTWKNRFPGWEKRVQNGYNQISVGEYLQLENQYKRIMQAAGLPVGFYDDHSDFGNWIANNVSPDEVSNRVAIAADAARKVDPTARDLLTKFYGVTAGDLTSYFLDKDRALPVLDKQYKAVNVATFAAKNGLKVNDPSHYEDLVDQGVTAEQAANAYGTIKQFSDAFGSLGKTYGIDYSQQDAEQDVFFNRNDKRKKLANLERANFSGSSRGVTGSADRGTSY